MAMTGTALYGVRYRAMSLDGDDVYHTVDLAHEILCVGAYAAAVAMLKDRNRPLVRLRKKRIELFLGVKLNEICGHCVLTASIRAYWGRFLAAVFDSREDAPISDDIPGNNYRYHKINADAQGKITG